MSYRCPKELSQYLTDIPLEYNGYAIKKFLFPKEEGDTCCDLEAHKTFRLHPNRYFLRSELFGLQRYLGKWGGDMLPEYDRAYSLFYFVFLQAYKVVLPSPLKGHWHGEPPITDADRERAASLVRTLFLQSVPSPDEPADVHEIVEYGLAEDAQVPTINKSLEMLPHLLAQAYNSPFIAYGCAGVELACYYGEGGWYRETAKAFAERGLRLFLARGECARDDTENGLTMNLLSRAILRKPDIVKQDPVLDAAFKLMYLHLYRTRLPTGVQVEPWSSHWAAVPFETKEKMAAKFRKQLALLREKASKSACLQHEPAAVQPPARTTPPSIVQSHNT